MRRLVALRLLVKRRHPDERLQDGEQQPCGAEAHQRGYQQGLTDLGGLAPIDAAGTGRSRRHQLIHETDADNGSNKRVRAGGGQPEPPGAEIPKNGGNQQRKHHGKAGPTANLQDQLDGQQRHDAEGDGARGHQHAEEIESS